MAKTSNAQIKAVDRYNKANTKTYLIRLNRKTDAEIIETLESFTNKQGFIKDLIKYSHPDLIRDLRRLDKLHNEIKEA